jgi:hypothetical protein
MGFLDLPGELLDEIIDLTLPSGLESFVLSCKTIYRRAAMQIAQHNEFRKLWRYASTPSNDGGKSLHLLNEISSHPLIAQYIDVLSLYNIVDYDSPPEVPDHDFALHESNFDRIERLVMESYYIQKAGVDVEVWWGKIMKEVEQEDEENAEGPLCTVVSLLAQLPNLVTFQPPNRWQDIQPMEEAPEHDRDLVYVLDSLIECSNAHGDPTRPLRKLKTILPYMPKGYDARAGLQCVEPFLTLQGLRELFVISCLAVNDDTYTGIPFRWRSKLDSPLRRVELAYCCMDAAGISALLEHTPLLEVFRYSHQTKWHGCEYDWNPGAFVETIAQNCGSTITHLALTIDTLDGEVINGASSFHGFRKLQHLEIDADIFYGPPIESGQRKGQDAMIPVGEREWTIQEIPCLGSMVNPPIVEIDINLDFPNPDQKALRVLLKDVKTQKATRLHQLNVVLRQYDGEWTKDLFAIPGLVTVFDGSQGGERPRAMLPAWKREFEQRVGGIARMG